MQHISSTPEEWRPVVGWEDYAEVSSRGRVRTMDRETLGIDGRIYRQKGKMRTQTKSQRGHLVVQLTQGKRVVNAFVHRLVLEAFVGTPPLGMEACHNDGNPTNNHVHNLRWDTQSANTLDMVKHGVHNHARKVRCKRGHGYEDWNLVASTTKRGGRQCKACHSAAVRVNRYPEMKPHIQKVADSYYQEFMHRVA